MKVQLDFFRWTRQNLIELLEACTLEQANCIPEGLKNNIIWNAGHIHAVHQILVYQLSELPMIVDKPFIDRYITGTVPDGRASQEEWDQIKGGLRETTVTTTEDFVEGKFQSFTPFSANYGPVKYHFTSIEESFPYNNLHEALHLGYMRALRNKVME